MSQDVVVGYLVAEKSPNSYSTDFGTQRREERPLVCILVFTHTKLICVKVGSTHGLLGFLLYGPLAWLITRRAQKANALWLKENKGSLKELLGANEHFEIDYSYIEKLELKKKSLKVKVSWNPEYLDMEMRFTILEKQGGTDCCTILGNALPSNFVESCENASFGERRTWIRSF